MSHLSLPEESPSTSRDTAAPPSSDVATRAVLTEQEDRRRHDLSTPEIFLSHSGHQKPFVARLYDALVKASYLPFLDQYSLPKGEPFPDRIKQAAQGCKLGVVVLSSEYVTSHWPMLELEIFRAEPSVTILPLFYQISPGDVKDPAKLSAWRSEAWEDISSKHPEINLDSWHNALKYLATVNGLKLSSAKDEADFIEQIVHAICERVPPRLRYDLSYVKGDSRLIEEVAKRFEFAEQSASSSSSEACFVGLHGIGGSGKTTICKLMVNYYWPSYPGKCVLLDLPTDGHKGTIAKRLGEVIQQLDGPRYNGSMKRGRDFDQSGVHRKADVHQWLSILYRDTHSSTQILQHMRQLALDGLIQYEKISVRHFDTMSVDHYERVLVHDLYVDLATLVKANITDYRSRFCLREGSELTEVIQRSAYSEIREVREEGMLRRSDDFGEPPSFMFVEVVSCGLETSSLKSSESMRYCGSRIIDVNQQQQDWSQLEVLVLKDCIIPQGLHLSKMRFLRALTLSDVRLKYLKGWRSATSLAVLKLKSCTPCDGRGQLEQLSGLANLRYLEVDGSGPWEGWPDLRRCGCLETLKIKNYIYSASQYSATVAVLLVVARFIIRLAALSIYVFVIGITVFLAGFGCQHMFFRSSIFRSSTLPCGYNAR